MTSGHSDRGRLPRHRFAWRVRHGRSVERTVFVVSRRPV
jgi:hypothetical protein